MILRGVDGSQATRGVFWSQFAIWAVVACATSGESKTQFSVTHTDDFSKPEAVAVFGIFRNGRLSPESWEQFGAALSAPFSPKACEAAYTADLVGTNPELTAAVDDYAKENGVTDELLERLASAAKGDTIMVINMTGQPARPSADAGVVKTAKPASAQSSPGQGNYGGAGNGPNGGRGMGRGGGGFGRGGFGGRRPPPAADEHPKPKRGVWEISASFFSVRLHHSVSEVNMTYSGQDPEGALRAFADKLAVEVPGVPCRGWDWSAPVDSASVRQMLEP